MLSHTNKLKLDNRIYWSSIGLFTVFYINNLFTVIYGIDASIYASISAEMVESNNWLQIVHKGRDYLDKPPLHFWLSALSFKIFGINSFAYKLPSYLFTILGTYSVYRLGKILYNKDIGKLSALLFYTCFSIILINLDVRTDTILVGIVVFSIWNLIAYTEKNNYWNFLFGFIGIGLAMLVKGPIGLMVPVLALGTHFLIQKDWRNIFKWQWLLGLLIIVLIISPMLWGLYSQFDAQPDKITKLSSGLEEKGVSGLRFYFWDQSFGRISGDNKEWKNDAGYFFFVHTALWSLLPWLIAGVASLFKKIIKSVNDIKGNEFYTLGAIILPFIAMSMSQYKLPHYILVFFPMWFILIGWFLCNSNESTLQYRLINHIQNFINICLVLISFLVCLFIFKTNNLFIWVALIFLTALFVLSFLRLKNKSQYITTTVISFAMVAFVFSFHFMPSVLKYDAPYNASIKSKELTINRIFSNDASSLAFDIYSNKNIEFLSIDNLHEYANNNNYIFVSEENIDIVKSMYKTKAVYEFDYFAATQLTANFLNPNTRESSLSKYYLVEI